MEMAQTAPGSVTELRGFQGLLFLLADLFTRNKTKICQRKFPTPCWRRQEAGSKWKWPCLSLEDKPRGNGREHINKHINTGREGEGVPDKCVRTSDSFFSSIAFQGHRD